MQSELNADAAAKAIALVERYQRRSADTLAMTKALPLSEPVTSYEPTAAISYDAPLSPAPMEAEPPKRKPGRPKGSKNKPKQGRPKGSKNRPK